MFPPQPPGYPPLGTELLGKVKGFIGEKLNRLGPDTRWQNFRLLNYGLGALILTYSTLKLVYDLNIDLQAVLRLPLFTFFREQVIPFIAYPVRFVGLELSDFLATLLSVSLIGGSIWANAEYRHGKYLSLYPLRKPDHVGFKRWRESPPLLRPPPKFLSRRSASRLPHALLLGYTMVGLLPAVLGIAFAVVAIARYAWEFGMLIQTVLLFACQRFLVRFEKPGHDDDFGTRCFLAVYRRYRNADDRLRKHLRRPSLIRATPSGPIAALTRDIVAEAARVSVVWIGLVSLLVLLAHLEVIPTEPFRRDA